jgi:hypothetical protein
MHTRKRFDWLHEVRIFFSQKMSSASKNKLRVNEKEVSYSFSNFIARKTEDFFFSSDSTNLTDIGCDVTNTQLTMISRSKKFFARRWKKNSRRSQQSSACVAVRWRLTIVYFTRQKEVASSTQTTEGISTLSARGGR